MTSPPSAVLSVENLRKSFGDLWAVNGVGFHVMPGETSGWGFRTGRARRPPST